ncbi:MAG: hypothetical protein RL220_401, partial [Bacteroidota bacterium]
MQSELDSLITSGKVRNIIFDFGGVLFEIDYHAPVRAFADLGFGSFAEIYSQAAQNPIFDELETGRISNQNFMNFLYSLNPGVDHNKVDQAWNSILTRLIPEQVGVVQEMKRRGIRTFLLSNTNAIHVAEFEKMIDQEMGLENFRSAFDQIYYSNVIGLKKPHEEVFLKLCEWNGLNPAETLFIDDSIQHVEGARKAGLQAW